jgi:drug/metabolite transporter (DMT)-like permease
MGGVVAAIIAAFSNTTEVISDKILLRQKNIHGRTIMVYQMAFIFLLTVLPAIFFGKSYINIFQIEPLLTLAGIVVCAIIFNNLYFIAIDGGQLCNIEPIAILSLPLSALLGSIFYPKQSSLLLIVLTTISLVVLLMTRIEKHHLKPNKYTAAMAGFVVFISIEAVLLQNMLRYLNPVLLYSVRTFLLATIFLVLFRPKKTNIEGNTILHFFLISLVVVVEYFARYFAYQQIGIVRSSLIFLLGPVLILIFSIIFLKEKVTAKRAIGDIIVVACVLASIFV